VEILKIDFPPLQSTDSISAWIDFWWWLKCHGWLLDGKIQTEILARVAILKESVIAFFQRAQMDGWVRSSSWAQS